LCHLPTALGQKLAELFLAGDAARTHDLANYLLAILL
jgi:hypothetical protein